jgi:hypothetical protein
MVKQILPKAGEAILALFNKLGGNMNNVLGSRSNITFLGKGKNPEGFIDSDINIEAIGVLGKNKILEELESSIGYLTAGKLNDVQANKLLTNMQKVDEVFNPKQIPNITDMATGTRNLDQEGLGALRAKGDYMTDEGVMASETILPMRNVREGGPNIYSTEYVKNLDNQIIDSGLYTRKEWANLSDDLKEARRRNFDSNYDDAMEGMTDLPPPGSRGGPDDIAAPIQDAETTIKNLEKQDPILAAQMKKMMDEGIMSTVGNRGDVPSKRASAREFLVEALKKDEMDVGTAAFGKTNLNNVISAEDVRYITEGGGGIGGDPIVLVEKYFGPRIAEALPTNASNEEILIFTKRVLENVEDAAGLKPDNPNFDRFTARFVDEMAKGGRVGLKFGKAAGKAFGLAKKLANINKSVDEGTQMGYGALRKYGIEAEDITRLFKDLAMDKTLVGPEKTEYFKMLNQVLKNPDEFPDGIIEIKKRLGMDFARGGLAKILEV